MATPSKHARTIASAPGPTPGTRFTEQYARLVARETYFWSGGKDADYIKPEQREVCCPNQDVVYGAGPLALDLGPVVVQVPDVGERFFVYQVVDLAPKGINDVFRSATSTGFICPRLFMDDTDADRKAIQPLISQVDVYPLSEYDGTIPSLMVHGILHQ